MSYKKLNDETFPTSLLMEFDELDDEFLISPPGLTATEKADAASGSRSPVTTSHTSNSSSGNYSLSTENENGSGSSSSSNPTAKFRTTISKRITSTKDAKRTAGSKGLTKSTSGQKRAKSMENLRHHLTLQPQSSGGHSLKRQQKYGHVKSKVKQFIDEAISQRGRHVLVRHKSMPETNTSLVTDEPDEIDHETDLESLRVMLREKNAENDNLQRHLEFSEIQREDGVIKIESLKRKIEAMRLEESKRQAERDLERQRERDMKKELDRQMVMGAYLKFNRIFVTTSTQTSPEPCTTFDISTFGSEDSFDRVMAASSSSQPNAFTGPRVKRTLQYALEVDHQEPDDDDDNNPDDISPDSATHPESSPDYPQLVPAIGRLYHPANQSTIIGHAMQSGADNDVICQECARKRKKKASKKARLASFFCIRKAD